MTGSGTAEHLPGPAGRTLPPWLWVWLGGYLLASMPGQISLLRSVISTYFGHSNLAPQFAGFFAVERLAIALSFLIYAVVVGGAVAAMLPRLRGRWVERRFKLVSDDRAVMAEMQRFVDSHDPSVRLRVTIRADQMARIYPVGWRSARIAVFRPLPALWRSDREAAQAVLLHELAHRRQGDQLIVGLGSPFVWLIRIWAPAYLLLVVIPITIDVAAGGSALAQLLVFQGIEEAAVIPGAVFLPVTALWLAELSADRVAAQAIGSGAVQRALRATAGSRASMAAQAIALLSHPPRRLRLRAATARPAATAALVAVWPAAVVAWLLVLPAGMVAAGLLLAGISLGPADTYLKPGLHALLVYGRPLAIVTAVVLLVWPVLAAPWAQLWSSSPRSARRQTWWPYLAAASLPVGVLLLFLVPLQASPLETGPHQPRGLCSQFESWSLGNGPADDEHVATELGQLVAAGNNKTATAAAARRLDGAIQAALANPPPGAARSSYAEAMTDYRVAAQDMRTGNAAAAATAMEDANGPDEKVSALITDLAGQCNASS
jgi:hypothetical protein